MAHRLFGLKWMYGIPNVVPDRGLIQEIPMHNMITARPQDVRRWIDGLLIAVDNGVELIELTNDRYSLKLQRPSFWWPVAAHNLRYFANARTLSPAQEPQTVSRTLFYMWKRHNLQGSETFPEEYSSFERSCSLRCS